ncbi:LysM peptidoglycan-binding domain-containing protein [Candidatus Ventrimonas sp. KK005]|nr:LysM peptidoglycan-binding domain-containing protein [Lachnospiraceae bacterium]NBH16549.1 LysM peptidoglycan-binding domain-containing protein [Clostridiaceae bacterium]
MGEFYNPYPKLPKNIRQIGERDLNVKLYVEDYVNTYLKRLYPTGGQDLRVGLLVGEIRTQEGMPYLFVDGALEMEDVVRDGSKVDFTEEAWDRAYHAIEEMFPKRTVLGWFLCSVPDRVLSPLNYWKQHGRYFPEKNQLMYLSCGLDGEESVYVASEDGFYKLRGYCIYYERNQMMQDYMVSRRDVRRVESGTKETIIRDFRQKMEDNKEDARRRRSTLGSLQTACGVLSVLVLACGVAMFNNYHRIKEMESVIASALPEDMEEKWSGFLGKEQETKEQGELLFEEVAGEVYPTKPNSVIEPESMPSGGNTVMAGSLGEEGNLTIDSGMQAPESQDALTAGAEGSGLESGQAQEIHEDGVQSQETYESQETKAENPAEESAKTSQGEEASAAQPVQVPSDAIVHVVKDGETLYGICIEYYHSVNNLPQICQWNQLGDENRLSVGQELYLPPME